MNEMLRTAILKTIARTKRKPYHFFQTHVKGKSQFFSYIFHIRIYQGRSMETCRVVGIDSILSTGRGWEGGFVGVTGSKKTWNSRIMCT